jgi:hypothetical protein
MVRILVKTAVQPDPELSDKAVRSRCGELHLVRLSGCLIGLAAQCRLAWVHGADTFGLGP